METKMKNLKSEYKRYIETGMLLLFAFAGVYGVSEVCALTQNKIFSGSVGSLALYVMLYLLLKQSVRDVEMLTEVKTRKRRMFWGVSLSIFFAMTILAGYQLRMNGMLDGGIKGKAILLLESVALSVAVWPFVNALLRMVERWGVASRENSTEKPFLKKRYLFLVLWAGIFLSWIPVFLAYYPAIMSYDFHRQSIEAMMGFEWFYDYQPLAHTWLFWVAFQIGKAADSLQFGMACYTVVQMLVFAAAGAYSCVVVYKLCKKRFAPFLAGAFWAFFPFVSVFAVCTTKDVYFTAFFVIFVCLFAEIVIMQSGKNLWLEAVWVLEGVLMMLFRNNALYAVAVFMVAYLFLGERKHRVRMLVLCLLLCIGGKGASEGMHLVLGTQIRSSGIEMFSVPINQFARVGSIHGENLPAEISELIDQYVPKELWEKYNPWISDPIKGNMGTVYDEEWEGNLGNMLLAWAEVGLHYPNEYIDAFLHLTSGYWFIDDVSWAEVLGYGREGRMGAIYTYTSNTSEVIPEGIPQESRLPGLQYVLEGIVSDNCFFEWPVISILFKPAFYSLMLLGMFLMGIYVKQKDKWLFYLLPLAYLATMFLGPVTQSRYILPIMMITPLILAAFGYRKKEV